MPTPKGKLSQGVQGESQSPTRIRFLVNTFDPNLVEIIKGIIASEPPANRIITVKVTTNESNLDAQTTDQNIDQELKAGEPFYSACSIDTQNRLQISTFAIAKMNSQKQYYIKYKLGEDTMHITGIQKAQDGYEYINIPKTSKKRAIIPKTWISALNQYDTHGNIIGDINGIRVTFPTKKTNSSSSL